MKRKLLVLAIGAAVIVAAWMQPFVRVMVDPDFGAAVTYRFDTGHKFETLFLWRW